MLNLVHNGKNYYGITAEEALEMGVSTTVVDAAVLDFKWKDIRAKRDGLLNASDWAVMPDSPVADKQVWLDYRTALRDLPQTYSADPDSVVWPVAP